MTKYFIVILLLLLPRVGYPLVKVAFLEVKGPDGKNLELEAGAPFAHLAISYRGQWLHALPAHGVELVTEEQLEEIGSVAAVIEMEDQDEPATDFVNSILGSPYEMSFSWDSNRYYCSKLVGKILHLVPEPMNFNAPAWPEYFHKYNGLPGISPQAVFRQLVAKGYTPHSTPTYR